MFIYITTNIVANEGVTRNIYDGAGKMGQKMTLGHTDNIPTTLTYIF